MRPTREGRHTPWRAGLVFSGIGTDPDVVTTDPPDPTDRASSGIGGQAFVPFGVQGTNDLFFGSEGGPNAEPGNVTPNVWFDGDHTTYGFCVGNSSQIWDAGSPVTIDEIHIYWSYGTLVVGAGAAGAFAIDGGDSASGPWTEVLADADPATTAGVTYPDDFDHAYALGGNETYRYWRFRSTTINNNDIFSIEAHGPDQVVWVNAALTIDGNSATFNAASSSSVGLASDVIWRGTLADSYLIASLAAEIGFETAGSVTVTVQAGNEADYSDAVTLGSDTITATGGDTSDDVTASWSPSAVYRYWQLVLDDADGVVVYEVHLFDPPEFTGAHGDLTGRSATDQHPASSVTFDPTGTPLTATNAQDAIEEAATLGGGPETPVDHGSIGATETIDVSAGTWHQLVLDANSTITVTGYTVDEGVVALVKVTQDGTGGWDLTWDADVVFAGDDQPGQTAGDVTWFLLWSDEGDSTIYGAKVGGSAGSSLTVENEGSELATAATTLDFVGAGVTASGTGAEKTITIPGVTEALVRDAGRWEPVTDGDVAATELVFEDGDVVMEWVTGP